MTTVPPIGYLAVSDSEDIEGGAEGGRQNFPGDFSGQNVVQV